MKALIILFLLSLGIRAEIPQTGKNSIEYRKVEYKIWMTLVEEHKKISKDSAEINKKAQKLIQGFAAQQSLVNPFPDFADLAKDAKDILKLFPKDPLTLTIIGRCIYHGGNDHQNDLKLTVNVLEKANESMPQSKYSAFAKMLAAKYLYSTLFKAMDQKRKKANKYSENYLKAFSKYILSPCSEKELRFRVHKIKNFYTWRHQLKYIKPFHDLIEKNKHKLDTWLVEMAYAYYYRAQVSLTHHNGKFKDKFNDDHHHFYVSSSLHFKEAHNIRPNWPEAATELIKRTKWLEDGNSPKHWFLEAVKAEFDCQKAYNNYISSIYNNNEELIKFGHQCISTNRFDTLVPGMYVQVVLNVIHNLKNDFKAFAKMELYEELHRILKIYEQNEIEHNEYHTGFKNFHRAAHFSFAYRLGRYSHVRKLHQIFGDTLYKKAFCTRFRINFKPAISLSYAMSGPASKIVKTLQERLSWEDSSNNIKWRTEKEVDDLKSMIEDAKAMTTEKESELYFRKLKKIIDLEKKFNQGEWVNLTFDKGLPAWKIIKGNWEIIDKNTIQGNTLDHENQFISSEAFFKPPYVIEVEVESVKSNWRWKHLQAGLILGKMYGEQTGRTFWVDGLRKRVGIGYPEENPAGWDIEMKSKKNKISVFVWDGYHEFHTHDPDYVFLELDPEFKPGRVSLGIMPWYKLSGIVKYSSFRLKKVNFSKPPGISYTKERIAHFKQRCKEFPNKYVFEKLAVAYKEDKQYDKALEVLAEREKKWPSWWNKYFSSRVSTYTNDHSTVIKNYELALERAKDNEWATVKIKDNLAWYLSTAKFEKYRDPKRALKIALEINKKNKKHQSRDFHLGTLAAAYAANGQFEKAVETSKIAMNITKNEIYRKFLKDKMKLFESGEAYIETHN